jgi:extracellular factor (EF) 3-hydroxypalmitic acid methyl ester biosynthesis protein
MSNMLDPVVRPSKNFTVYSQTQIDPMVSFRNAQGEQVRGTIVNLQRKSLVMEIYNPHSIVQASEVLHELTVRLGTKNAYIGKAFVISMVNTGLTAIVSVTLIDEWRELSEVVVTPESVGSEAQTFVQDWTKRFHIRKDYQIAVNELRAFLSEVSRWVEQVDLSASLPKEGGRLRMDFFYELAMPIVEKTKSYMEQLEEEASKIDTELAPAHRSFAQATLHPLLLRAPFIFRTYTKPLGYAGDYQMVNQILDDPRQGPSTYFQMVNTAFLQTSVATAHRNRIDMLVDFLNRMADAARQAGRPFRIMNAGCGPATEIQRFLQSYPHPEFLSFELVDFSEETLAWTRNRLKSIEDSIGKSVSINYVHDSVHQLLKRRTDADQAGASEFDAVYCAGLFDYLSDKVCSRLMAHFATLIRPGGTLLVTNVHSSNPMRFVMEHLLEWYLIYRDEAKLASLLPEQTLNRNIYLDPTGVNIFAEVVVA